GKILVLNSGRCWVIRYCKRANLLVFLQPGESTKVRRTASSLRTLAALAFGDSARRVRIPGRNQERRRLQHSLGLGFRLRHPQHSRPRRHTLRSGSQSHVFRRDHGRYDGGRFSDLAGLGNALHVQDSPPPPPLSGVLEYYSLRWRNILQSSRSPVPAAMPFSKLTAPRRPSLGIPPRCSPRPSTTSKRPPAR